MISALACHCNKLWTHNATLLARISEDSPNPNEKRSSAGGGALRLWKPQEEAFRETPQMKSSYGVLPPASVSSSVKMARVLKISSDHAPGWHWARSHGSRAGKHRRDQQIPRGLVLRGSPSGDRLQTSGGQPLRQLHWRKERSRLPRPLTVSESTIMKREESLHHLPDC